MSSSKFSFSQRKYDKDKIKESLTIEQVFNICSILKAEPEYQNNVLIMYTVCHNELDNIKKKKLYYYHNNKNFYCFTECGSFDIFEFVAKARKMQFNEDLTFISSIQFVLSTIDENEIFYMEEKNNGKEKYLHLFNRYEQLNIKSIDFQKEEDFIYENDILQKLDFVPSKD